MSRRIVTGLGLMLAAGVLFSPDLPVDVIHPKDGGRFNVKSWRDVGDAIEFAIRGGTVLVLKADVERIERAPRSGDFPVPAAPATPTRPTERPDQTGAARAEAGQPPGSLAGGQEKQKGVTEPPAEVVARKGRWELSKEGAQKVEDGLKSNPDDLSARTRLLGYYIGPSIRLSGPAVTIEARRRHILWIIQNRPEAEVAGLPEATIDPLGHPLADKEGYRQARALWLEQAEKYKSNTSVLGNAAKFFQLHDKELAEDLLKRAQALDPSNPVWPARLGYLYGLGIMGVNGLVVHEGLLLPTSVDPSEATGRFARKSREELQKSSNAKLIRSAGLTLSNMGSIVRARGMSKYDYTPLAEELLKRAKALETSGIVAGEEKQILSHPSASQLAREGYALSREDAEKLEDKLRSNPDDLDTRARLLGYYFARSLRLSGAAVTLEARRRHIFWVIQNRPDAEIAGISEMTIDPAGHSLADPEGYQQARALWLKQVEAYKSNTAVLAHAAKFFQLHDKELAEDMLKRAQALEPRNPEWSASLGYLYALGIMGINGLNQNGLPTSVDPSQAAGAFAKKAREEVQKSSDPTLIVTAGRILSQYGSMIYAMRLSQQDYRGLAEELLKRAGGPGSSQVSSSFGQAWSLGQHYHLERLRALSAEAKTQFAKKELAQWEQAIPGAPDEGWRSGVLGDAAKAAVEAGELKKAEKFANELLEIASRHTGEEKYGPAVHDGNMILGRLALRQGNIQEAKAYLIKAGHTLGGGTLTSFGPNMSLAKELLERGERESVIEYLELCKTFWSYPRNPLEPWIQTIKAGRMPEFGPNLNY